ncbi:hypothetical protein [Rhodococcus opacus]|uniref:hypothetical protein n=1 Tax=Rhodococcus opacus TaxID=37919 RepID=UPI0010099D77|nr:hypothetical protein [Rhodococcus opacus]
MTGLDKDTKAVLKALKEAGFEIRKSKNGHPMVYKDEKLITTFSGSASDPRSFRNTLSYLKRVGFEWPPRR